MASSSVDANVICPAFRVMIPSAKPIIFSSFCKIAPILGSLCPAQVAVVLKILCIGDKKWWPDGLIAL